MRLLLDASAYSAFMRGHEPIRRAVRTNEEIFLNSIVIGELTAGFIKGSRRRLTLHPSLLTLTSYDVIDTFSRRRYFFRNRLRVMTFRTAQAMEPLERLEFVLRL